MYLEHSTFLTIHLIFIFISLLTGLSLIFLLIKVFINAKKIEKATHNLQTELTNKKVIAYGDMINKIDIPNRSYIWKTIQAGYYLIESNPSIDTEVKSNLKIILLSKGVLI